ncbi:MAG: NAD(P)/FAD-dependent oxidoreductase [Clostridia bacterium]|nr:NAD(P)/FAD-dependent oxidoreductase [Clostridia bacterium]
MAKILIIGGGVAGLSAGIYARLYGHDAVVCESHFVPGGNLTGWNRGDYHIDNCIHWLTGTNPVTRMYKMWKKLGALGEVEVFQGDALYVLERDGEKIGLYCDIDRIERRMLEISPEDKSETRRFIRAVKLMQCGIGIAGKKSNSIFTPEAPLGLSAMSSYYNMTTGELSSRFKHPLLKDFISAFWGEDFGVYALVFVVAHYTGKNAGIPHGSSTAMAERMSERFKSLGGELLLRKEAVKVNLARGRAKSVSFSDGTEISADYVILTPDPASVFGKILDIPMPRQLQRQYKNQRMFRFSSYHCAFACDMEKLPFEGDFIFEVPDNLRDRLEMNTPGIRSVIVREFSHEPSFAPTGKNILQTLTFCYEDDAKRFIALRDGDRDAYNAKKREIAEILIELIVGHFPEMRGKLECIDVWTPATYHRYTKSEMGSYMSFALPSKTIPLPRGSRVRGLKNVVLATQWQQSPGGLPIAAAVGKRAARKIAFKERIIHPFA